MGPYPAVSRFKLERFNTMKQKSLKLALSFVIGCMAVSELNAQDVQPINVVTTAVPFLRISPDARAGGMGEVGIATSPDVNAPFWNLAKTPFNTSKFQVGLTYTPWLKRLGLNDVFLGSMSGYYKLDDDQALSATLRYFNLGSIQFTDNLGNVFSEGRPREYII